MELVEYNKNYLTTLRWYVNINLWLTLCCEEVLKIEERRLKVTFTKSGAGNFTPRTALPKVWCDKLNITQEEREIIVIFDEKNEQILVKKAK